MPKVDVKRLAARFSGRPAIPQYSIVAGAATNTDIAVTGIKREDGLLAVLEHQPPTAGAGNAIPGDRVAETSVTSDGNIQLTTTNTTGNQLLVIWLQVRQ